MCLRPLQGPELRKRAGNSIQASHMGGWDPIICVITSACKGLHWQGFGGAGFGNEIQVLWDGTRMSREIYLLNFL